MRATACALAIGAGALLALACAGEGLDPQTLPTAVRPDYAVFAQKCSKCHSLSRPLDAHVTDDRFWVAYVARMRRQPGSGISAVDAEPILRFLHWYSEERRERGAPGGGSDAGATIGGDP
jgi:hypothetical protein